jgi:hypothetical protein
MIVFLRAGGVSTWLALAVGITILAAAVSYAWKPGEYKLARIRPLSLAMVFAALSGLASGLAATAHRLTTDGELARSPDFHLLLLTGIGEALVPAILGFAILAVAWLLVAVGLRRQD